jgi:hypothetical protein
MQTHTWHSRRFLRFYSNNKIPVNLRLQVFEFFDNVFSFYNEYLLIRDFHSRSVYDFLCICKDIFLKQRRCQCVIVALITVVFISGLLVGAATCGSYLGRFNSPILTCIDNFFIPNSYANVKDSYLSIS